MTWIKLADTFPDHPKIVAAGERAAMLYVSGLCYCSRHLTDGFIPADAVSRLSSLRNARQLASSLVRVGLWECTEGGFLVHAYGDWQQTREETESARQGTRERVQKHRAQKNSNGAGNGVTNGRVTPLEVDKKQKRLNPPVVPPFLDMLEPDLPKAIVFEESMPDLRLA